VTIRSTAENEDLRCAKNNQGCAKKNKPGTGSVLNTRPLLIKLRPCKAPSCAAGCLKPMAAVLVSLYYDISVAISRDH